MPLVFIIAEDWTLRIAVRAELREAGIEALGMERVADAARAIAEGTMPTVIVLEARTLDAAGPALPRHIPRVVVASHTERPEAWEAVKEGAAAVLYRPVSVAEIVAQVKQLLQGQPA